MSVHKLANLRREVQVAPYARLSETIPRFFRIVEDHLQYIWKRLLLHLSSLLVVYIDEAWVFHRFLAEICFDESFRAISFFVDPKQGVVI